MPKGALSVIIFFPYLPDRGPWSNVCEIRGPRFENQWCIAPSVGNVIFHFTEMVLPEIRSTGCLYL